MSPYRVWARTVIDQVIADNVHGPVGCLKQEDLLELRRALHRTVGFSGLSSWEKKILREEWRVTLGYPPKSRPKMRRLYAQTDVMPAMRDWAIRNGIIQPESL